MMFAHALLLVTSVSGSAGQYFDWCFRYEEVFQAVNPESETFVHPNGLAFKDVLHNAYDNSYFPDQGFYVIPAGKRGNYSFEIKYPKLPQGRCVLYTAFGKLLDESQGARYIDHGDWETYIIYDVYMKTGDYAVVGYTPDGAAYTPPSSDVAQYVTYKIRRQQD